MSRRDKIVAISYLGIFVMVIVGVGKVMRFREKGERSSCQSNLKQIMLGMKLYTRDYDELMPLKETFGEVIFPRGTSQQLFFCPVPGYGYRYNRNLSGMSEVVVWRSDQLASFYDAPGAFKSDAGESWPSDGVHMGGNNVAYLDGHVKWTQKKPVFWMSEMKEWPALKELTDKRSAFWGKPKTAATEKRKRQLDKAIRDRERAIRMKYGGRVPPVCEG